MVRNSEIMQRENSVEGITADRQCEKKRKCVWEKERDFSKFILYHFVYIYSVQYKKILS